MFFKKGYKKTKRRAPYARKRNARAGRKSGSVTVAVKQYVKKTLHAQVENKIQNTQAGFTFGNVLSSSGLAMNMYPMTPYASYWTIGQGVTQNTRIGNVIKPVKVMLRYVIRPTPYNAESNVSPVPVEIDMFLGHTKATPALLPNNSDLQFLYQIGSSSGPPIGNLTDIIAPINKDYWTISKRWRHKLGFAEYGTNGTQPTNQNLTNNDFKLNAVRSMNITQYVPKKILFNDGGGATTSKGLFFFYQAVSATGTTLASTQYPMNIQFWIDFEYEDA